MAHKRSRQEFEEDSRKHEIRTKTDCSSLDDGHARDGKQNQPSSQQGLIDGAPDAKRAGEVDEWQVVQSNKKKKKKVEKKLRAAEEEAKLAPTLRFDPYRGGIPVRIKDLQSLVLYVLADGVAPTWVAVKNARKIDQVVVLMIPGMDKKMLEDATAQTSASVTNEDEAAENIGLSDRKHDEQNVEGNDIPSHNSNDKPEAMVEKTKLSDYIIRVKAPGDPKSGRMHSPLQTMLISQNPEAKNYNGRYTADVFQPVETPLHTFIHTSDELVDAEFPVHMALFTNSSDAQFEQSRRETAGQSASNGWVDSLVESFNPVFPVNTAGAASSITSGLTVYALDCEMVLTDDDKYSLARISILNWHGKVILDQLVVPDLPIKNYFTQFSGITEAKLKGVTTRLSDIQATLLDLLTPSTVLIGHSLESDLNAMKITHPFIVDTSMIYPHPRGLPLRSSLKFLSNKYLRREIQKGGADGHDSVEDARAVLDLVRLKCEKGPTWGTLDANGESIFSRLARSGHMTAIVEHGTPERGFGQKASIKIGCGSDDEVTEGLIKVTSKDATVDVGGKPASVAFTWARLRDMEAVRGWNSTSKRYTPVPTSENADKTTTNETGTNGTGTNQTSNDATGTSECKDPATHTDLLTQTTKATTARLVRIYTSLAPSTLLIVYPGPGDMREVLRLQEMQRQYRKEFKVKKWDELSVQWTDDEEQALRKAFEKAREGWGLVWVK